MRQRQSPWNMKKRAPVRRPLCCLRPIFLIQDLGAIFREAFRFERKGVYRHSLTSTKWPAIAAAAAIAGETRWVRPLKP